MQLRAVSILALLLPSLAMGVPSLQLFGQPQIPFTPASQDLMVPGQNPFSFCASPETNILTIESVDLDPNPPTPGETLLINATGIFSKKVDYGSKVYLQVKYGLIRLINEEADLCEQITNVDLSCPLEKGPMTIAKEVLLPKEIPPGKYTVYADVNTKEKERITCLKAEIMFNL
ncbi:phosphatidylglycerol/phosphatidylinositol transfer protein [Paracoccidioides lutzii Pb01]|uniref:Phosphatidylglycerol/phosphatidylinositol transfer protein n=1 Tax=Paracoccidioides lutzii (strain ATCC MYA-826 / Pb01) TaxID=502779 RepID=C1GYS5_PARBA|nr:phosphatidylglycerol/phosphatidylinositol transfer protein [Paracoccidioides lutzii Pb01]EEH41748.2 phosphatidylglycerol/phosphatidylinositol transfer protein [Paracoccidioides lutzii Pb01]